MNLVILHTYEVAVPAPAQRDTCVRNVVDGVVLDVDTSNITCSDGNTAPVLVGDVVKFVIADSLSCADFAEVGGRVGQMGFETFRGEGAADVAIHGDIGKGTV